MHKKLTRTQQRQVRTKEKIFRVAMDLFQQKGFENTTVADFTEARLEIDSNRALAYSMTPTAIAAQLPLAGIPVALSGNLVSMDTQFVRLYFDHGFAGNLDTLRLVPIQTAKGPVPLETFAKITYGFTANKIERNRMLYSVDVSGYRRTRPISIMTATGCTYGKSNIQKLYYNKMAFTLVDTKTGRSVRVSLKPEFFEPEFFEQALQSPFVQQRKAEVPPQDIPAEIADPLINKVLAIPVENFLAIGAVKNEKVIGKKGLFEARPCEVCGELTFVNKLRMTPDGKLACIPCSGYAD